MRSLKYLKCIMLRKDYQIPIDQVEAKLNNDLKVQ